MTAKKEFGVTQGFRNRRGSIRHL